MIYFKARKPPAGALPPPEGQYLIMDTPAFGRSNAAVATGSSGIINNIYTTLLNGGQRREQGIKGSNG
jgi:hypothetical protein